MGLQDHRDFTARLRDTARDLDGLLVTAADVIDGLEDRAAGSGPDAARPPAIERRPAGGSAGAPGHTPLPWELHRGAHSGFGEEFSIWRGGSRGDGDQLIASWIRGEGDAALFLAAPRMLRALEVLRDYFAETLEVTSSPGTRQTLETHRAIAQAAISEAKRASARRSPP